MVFGWFGVHCQMVINYYSNLYHIIYAKDLIKLVMHTLVSRDCVPFCKYIKRHVYLRNQGTHDKLNEIQ